MPEVEFAAGMAKSRKLLSGFFVVSNSKNFAVSATFVIFLWPQAQSLALETVPFQFCSELEPQLYGQVLTLGKPWKHGAGIAVLMISCYDVIFYCLLHKRVYLLPCKQLLALSL